ARGATRSADGMPVCAGPRHAALPAAGGHRAAHAHLAGASRTGRRPGTPVDRPGQVSPVGVMPGPLLVIRKGGH
ncbi:MAG: hypothetical protein OXR73_04985, partial [Myxococcales bacterium]|nr:hypothetical protein [Myxococcales bacterium]